MLNVGMDMGMKTWTLAWTSTYSMNTDMGMLHGHGQAACTGACSMDMS
jgi:hypothetical protein